MPGPYVVNTLLVGNFSRETIINSQNIAYIDFPGGNVLYTAYAVLASGGSVALISKISENYPEDWIHKLEYDGINTDGIKRLASDIDCRRFFRVFNNGEITSQNPYEHFLKIGQAFPKVLLGYSSTDNPLPLKKEVNPTSILPSDLSSDLSDVNNIYLSDCDFASLSLLPAHLRSINKPNIFIKITEGFFKPARLNEISSLLNSAKIVFTYEEELKNLLLNKQDSAWEAARIIGNFNVEMVIFFSGFNQINMYISRSGRRITIPVFYNNCIDTVGCFDTFIGGFLGNYTKYFDPISSAALGSAVMGIKLQGTKPEYILGTLPELIHARFEKMKAQISSIM